MSSPSDVIPVDQEETETNRNMWNLIQIQMARIRNTVMGPSWEAGRRRSRRDGHGDATATATTTATAAAWLSQYSANRNWTSYHSQPTLLPTTTQWQLPNQHPNPRYHRRRASASNIIASSNNGASTGRRIRHSREPLLRPDSDMDGASLANHLNHNHNSTHRTHQQYQRVQSQDPASPTEPDRTLDIPTLIDTDHANTSNTQGATDTPSDQEGAEFDIDESDVTMLTQRLRCLFGILTCPIVPLAASLTLLLLWVLYSALMLDWGKPCDQPLRTYALLSACMFAYTPHHRAAKRILFGYWRERDGPVRPRNVRMYDQFYHALCLLWMYAGITWTSNCKTCMDTSPHLYSSIRVFVLVQTVFMTILVIPLLCLPCIYLWLVRQASLISATRGHRSRKKFDPKKVMASMAVVKQGQEEELEGKECCICMSEFSMPERSEEDVEESLTGGIVKTRCEHLFHKACLSTWLESPYSTNCRCPLCRKSLSPEDRGGSDGSTAAEAVPNASHDIEEGSAGNRENTRGAAGDGTQSRRDQSLYANEVW